MEALVLPEGTVMDQLKPAVREQLKRGSATTILLWEGEVEWYMPSPKEGLTTLPGLRVTDSIFPSDPQIKYSVQYVMQTTRRGGNFKSAEEHELYFANPRPIYIASPPFKFPVPSEEQPEFHKTAGNYLTYLLTSQAAIL